MKKLTKLALVSAITASSGQVMAMQSLDDEAMSAATGRDGITLNLAGISLDYIAIHDTDGVVGAATAETNGITTANHAAGAIILGSTTEGSQSFNITATEGIDVVIDADGNGSAPVLNIGLSLGDTIIKVGTIQVATSTGSGAIASTATVADAVTIGDISLSGLEVNVQLGNQPQGALIKLDSTITGGLNISSLGLVGANGTLTLGGLGVTTHDSENLTLDLLIDPTTSGLSISGLGAVDVSASSVKLGDTNSIGALYVSNLNVGTITIAGH